MSDIPFHRTQMGHRYYTSTMPDLVRQLTRLNDLLEKVVNAVEVRPAQRSSEGPSALAGGIEPRDDARKD